MKIITTVLKAREALDVRRAVAREGANNFVLFPTIRREEFGNWNCGSTERDNHVRIEITAEDDRLGGILSAIMKAEHVGKIEAFTVPSFYRKLS